MTDIARKYRQYDSLYHEIMDDLKDTYSGKEATFIGSGKFKGRKVTILESFHIEPSSSWRGVAMEKNISCLVGFHRKDDKEGYITEDPYYRTYYRLSELNFDEN